jgi:hypothetical protein
MRTKPSGSTVAPRAIPSETMSEPSSGSTTDSRTDMTCSGRGGEDCSAGGESGVGGPLMHLILTVEAG